MGISQNTTAMYSDAVESDCPKRMGTLRVKASGSFLVCAVRERLLTLAVIPRSAPPVHWSPERSNSETRVQSDSGRIVRSRAEGL